MFCSQCNYENADRSIANGTFCPKCSNYILPDFESPLKKELDKRRKISDDWVRDYLTKKRKSHANRNR